jgi:hypothetical protein
LPLERIAKELGVTLEAVRSKFRRLGLEEDEQSKTSRSSSTADLPKELFTVEQVLLSLARAVKALEQPGLDRDEVLREKVKTALAVRGVVGGVLIFHGFRYNLRHSWYWSPHFHVLGVISGGYGCRGCKKGCVGCGGFDRSIVGARARH